MQNEASMEELDDKALRLRVARKLKSKSFKALAKRIDRLVGDCKKN